MKSCYCDNEPASIYDVKRPIARKAYRCHECAGTIDRGDRYERVYGLWDDQWEHYRTCSGCLMIRDHLALVRPCFCWAHGSLASDIEAEMSDGWEMRDGRYIDTWPPGGRFRALALMAQARLEWVRYGEQR